MTPDEQVTADVLLGRCAGEAAPDLVVCVTDATNLRQNLRLVLSLKRLGLPMVVALNMTDIARRKGIVINAECLAAELGVPVVETVGIKASGAGSLIKVLGSAAIPARVQPAAAWRTPTAADIEHDQTEVRRILKAVGADRLSGITFSDKVDAVVLHPVIGPLILASILFLVFQAVFAWAQAPMDAIRLGVGVFGDWLRRTLPASLLKDSLINGVLAGVGSVLVFLPQIIILFFFHPAARGLRILAARGISARPADGQRRTVGTRLHSPVVELRVRNPRHHGDAHHSKSARSNGDHHDRAADDVLGTAAGLCT